MMASTACSAWLSGSDNFDFYFWQKIHGVFAAAIDFRVAFLAAKPFHFGHGHAVDADFMEGVFDFFEFERFDDGFDFFHKLILFAVGAFAMLGEIQAETFVFNIHAQTDQGIHGFKQHQGGDAGKADSEQHGDYLVDQLMRSAGQ